MRWRTVNVYCLLARRGQRRDAHSYGKQNNIIICEILVLTIRFIEQKVIIFRCRTDFHDEPARPEPAQTGEDAL